MHISEFCVSNDSGLMHLDSDDRGNLADKYSNMAQVIQPN